MTGEGLKGRNWRIKVKKNIVKKRGGIGLKAISGDRSEVEG
jgi:hypothetical protein